MSRPVPNFCENCGKNITMSGSKICPHCDPDIEAIVMKKVKRKSPELCDACHEEHLKSHPVN